jgi:signal transduction histidine kinase
VESLALAQASWALNHARAEKVEVSLHAKNSSIILEIRDDGIGISKDGDKDGLGLRIMRNRASVIGADLSIKRARPKGTVVTCTVPKERRLGWGVLVRALLEVVESA